MHQIQIEKIRSEIRRLPQLAKPLSRWAEFETREGWVGVNSKSEIRDSQFRPRIARSMARKRSSRSRAGGEKRISRLHKPDDLTLEVWQRELRRQFGAQQPFLLENLGKHPVFSDFRVSNPEKGTAYRVAIRSAEPGRNFCSCRDFATNTLGTCKHVEFVLDRIARKRGGARALRAGWEPPYSSVTLDYGAERHVRFRAVTRAPSALVRLASRWFVDSRLPRERFASFDRFLRQARAIDPALRVYEDAVRFVAEVRDASVRQRAVDRAFPSGIRSAAFRDLLRVPLYDYQEEGVLFAARAGRALIGDEMGLGKTLEAIGATEVMAKCFGIERVLVIAPTSLKHQWEREIERLAPRPIAVIGGLRPRRAEGFASASFYKIMNYDTVERDLDLIRGWEPDLVILDEAQRIKNWNTHAARAVKSIDSPYAMVLTGTPLENRLEELVSIVEFLDPFRLGPTFRFLDQHQVRDDAGRVVGYRNLDAIARTLALILIRRRKKEVLSQLPQRLEKHFFIPLTPEQSRYHEENREIVARIVAKWRRTRFLSEGDQRRLMVALQRMRMVCDSTYLIEGPEDHGAKPGEVMTLLEEMLEEKETKVVVFSQWLRMHELLQRKLDERGWEYVLFHGGVEGSKRKHLVDRFRERPECRIFLSTDAGGVGLNLQHANVVVNVDLPWNPAVLEQRIGRVHRIGQRQPVRVLNLVAENSIEHQMLSVLAFKSSLFAGVLDGGETEVFLGGTRLSKFMESVEGVTSKLEPPDPAAVAPPVEAPEEERRAMESDDRADAIGELLQAGLALLRRVGLGAADKARSNVRLETMRDPASGETFLKVPMPRRETVQRLSAALRDLLADFGGVS
jgi:superfamily II DNA or RNA helicase